ncbi:hypothetical protein [Pseudomonas sp. NPDC086251]|uniref:hypothetical protein n=1 Tax=Pseudomonas sp. NPDC086251 TaxID=3364431 RepID=UPI003832A0CF
MFPPMANPNLEITATEFEFLVRDWILKQGGELTSLEERHDVKVEAFDSTYQIDVQAKFQAFAGAEFIVLIECKKYRNQSGHILRGEISANGVVGSGAPAEHEAHSYC